MTYTSNLISKLILTLPLALLLSCQDKESEASNTENSAANALDKDTTAYTVADSTKFKFDLAIVNMPPPAANIQRLEQMGLIYSASYLNPTKNSDKYVGEFESATNLGAYNIDMAYAMIHGKSQDALDYIKVVMKVGDNLGLRNTMMQSIGKRAENNSGNKDSLVRIFNDLFEKSDDYLRTNKRLYVATLIFAGSWTESLYLNCKISEDASDRLAKAGARQVLWEQRFHLENLLKVLSDFRGNQEAKQLHEKMKSILVSINAVKQPSDFTDKSFTDIANRIIALRKDITKN